MHGISLDEAGIMSTVLEGILYGFSVFMFGGTVWALLHRRRLAGVNWTMLVIAASLLALSTSHLVVDIVRIEQGLVKYRDTFPGGPRSFFEDISQPTFIIKNAIYALQTLIGDGVVVYRCYVVWQSIWVIVVPILGMCCVAIGGIGSVYSVSRATSHSNDIFFKETGQWVTMFYAATFTTNFLATGLLTYRIWVIDNNAADMRMNKNSLTPVLMIIIDAGLLYSATLLAALICFTQQSNGQYIMIDLACPIISIAFYMILIRIAIHKSNCAAEQSVGLTTIKSQAQTGIPRHSLYGAKSLEVHITQLTEREHEHRMIEDLHESKEQV